MNKRKLTVSLLGVLLLAGMVILTGCPWLAPTTPAPDPDPPDAQPQPGEEVTEAPNPGDYFPLTEGSFWQYQGEGNEYASFSREIVFAQGDRAQVREDNGGTVSAAVFEVTEEAVIRTFFMGEAYDEEIDYLNEPANDNTIILQAPLEVGRAWEAPNGTREIVDLNATVETPAGTFDNCIQIQVSFAESTLHEYFKEGIGMVKREFATEGMSVTSSLESYEIMRTSSIEFQN